MYGKTIGFEQDDEALLAHAVCDEALEAAADARPDNAAAYTLAYCSGLSTCPA